VFGGSCAVSSLKDMAIGKKLNTNENTYFPKAWPALNAEQENSLTKGTQ